MDTMEFSICRACFEVAAFNAPFEIEALELTEEDYAALVEKHQRALNALMLKYGGTSYSPGNRVDEFSVWDCDCCGARLGGERYALTVYVGN